MNNLSISSIATVRNESGIALITALLLLVLVTIIAVAGSRNTLLQERMAGNMHDRNLAFQAAEAALSDAISQIQNGSNLNTISRVDKPTDPTFWQNYIEDSNNQQNIHEMDITGYTLSRAPRFVIEELESQPSIIADEALPPPWYRISVLAEGGTSTAVVILHSGYRR